VSAKLFNSAPLPGCHSTSEWGWLWPRLQKGIDEFLSALEARSRAPGLARRTRTILERKILQSVTTPRPLNIGGTLGVEIELTEAPADIHASYGIRFGSHSATYPYLTGLSHAGVVNEGARSRAILERGLKKPVTAFAYPHGSEDRAVQHLIGACGYTFGLSCRPGPSKLDDPMLGLPRIEITASDDIRQFISKINTSQNLEQ
jgi:peptidoglycan/xylan/chitin deacetylase (PgdA/CDA1 family)